MTMLRRILYRLAFERDQKRRCNQNKCATIQVGIKGTGYCARCGREYLWLKNEKHWLHTGTNRFHPGVSDHG